ncbi:hypothetical protein, partial [Klebsiella michiganensis]|uniref:hypothetical protein n=1 Tax=Klebsiella michiganensis TaxID=1134687 RepID=UPI00292F2B28
NAGIHIQFKIFIIVYHDNSLSLHNSRNITENVKLVYFKSIEQEGVGVVDIKELLKYVIIPLIDITKKQSLYKQAT